ncbi:hypothetical protein CC1G_06011 [Coprinopsis cinerea okayama7|uniref:Tc1-like transposase DDE domain-containing protein n=1 Tax=Coprinopsis cinerea (strain Okayama-7 / 130 / ATCC MYA-4618 / FGSC 9003) TaxID=240176 RepID=A8N4N3_COPC7|nr:hypothetical protein CC1G_06011 [Coprinopsis cinerea okayama7\|eukprot:XP_001829802.2 hypothetical protein CC1G_06011 [Coprinopsis cinerea okayama7\
MFVSTRRARGSTLPPTIVMGKRKRKAHPNTLANLKRGAKRMKEATKSPSPEPVTVNVSGQDEIESRKDAPEHEGVEREGWGEESDDEDDDIEVVDDPKLWNAKRLKDLGVYERVVSAALSGDKCPYLGDEWDDSDDETWLPPKKKWEREKRKREKKDRPSTYATGPDIMAKSERTQRRYKQQMATQTFLDDHIVRTKRPRPPPREEKSLAEETASVKVEVKEEPLPSTSSSIPDVQVRIESPEPVQLEFLDVEIRQESLTPPPLFFDEHPRVPPSPPLPGSAESADAPTVLPETSETAIDPQSGIECWEEELNDVLAPTASDIRPWDVLRERINKAMEPKQWKKLTQTHQNQYLILRAFATLRLRGIGRLEASQQIALQWSQDIKGSGVSFARRVRALARHYQIWEQLPVEKRGGYRNGRSVLKDESVQQAARGWLTAQKLGTVNPSRFRDGLNSEILPSLGISLKKPLCTRTATRWLWKLGWVKTKIGKGVYVDGHEREDVVHYRKHYYLPKMKEYSRRMTHYEPSDPKSPASDLKAVPPILGEGEKEIVAVFQDESCCHANEFEGHAWLKPGQQPLVKKGRGRLIMISEFICSTTGRLVVEDENGNVIKEARKIIYPGSNGDPYWDKKQLLEQVQNHAIPVFEESHPGKQALFIFDQSSAHAALADDALKAFEMNKSNGGAQRIQRDTVIPDSNPTAQLRGKLQPMTVPGPDGKPIPKGLEQVLQERGFNVDGLRAKCKPVCPFDSDKCCMARLLSKQDDFTNQVSELEQIIVDAGHLCLFLPKFHCELNPIEMYWGWVKFRYRQMAKPNFEAAKKAALSCLNACPKDVIRRFINRSWRFTEAYRAGLTGKAAAWAVRKYKGHRTISNGALMHIEALAG